MQADGIEKNPIEWVESAMGTRVPKRVHDLGHHELIQRIHGIVCGEYKCPGCGSPFLEQHYPSSRCVACGAPLPRICVTRSCGNRVEPLRVEDERGGVRWYEPYLDCHECQKFSGRSQRSAWIENITPPHIQQYIGSSYHWATTGRQGLDESLKQWFTVERCGADSRCHMLYVYGEEGCGKSVGVMFHAAKNHMSNRIEGLFYVSEDQLLAANANKYADQRESKEDAIALFAKCSGTKMLILDDMGNRSNYRPGQAELYGRVLGERIRLGRATIVIGRRIPIDGSPFGWVPGQLSSAFKHSGRSIRVSN